MLSSLCREALDVYSVLLVLSLPNIGKSLNLCVDQRL